MTQKEFKKLMSVFREYKQKLVYTLIINEHRFKVDIDISCNPNCVNETGKLITLCGMLSNKLKELLPEADYHDFEQKLAVVKQVFVVLKALNPEEEFIIERKYLWGSERHDSEIYTMDEFPHGRTKYYECKLSAWAKINAVIA